MAQIAIDLLACEGHALCAAVAPDVFTMGDDDKPVVTDEDLTAELLAAAREAARTCPCRAITISE